MLAKISSSIVDWQIRKGYLEDRDRAVYQYGYELLINQSINILVAVFISILFHSFDIIFIFLLSYIPLRSFCGGYHAGTNLMCTVISGVILCCVFHGVNYIMESPILYGYPVMFIFSGCFVGCFAPVADKNKPLDEEETIRYHKCSCIIWVIQVVIGLSAYIIWKKIGLIIASSHFVLVIMLWAGIIKNLVSLFRNE